MIGQLKDEEYTKLVLLYSKAFAEEMLSSTLGLPTCWSKEQQLEFVIQYVMMGCCVNYSGIVPHMLDIETSTVAQEIWQTHKELQQTLDRLRLKLERVVAEVN